jgi:hypothetical protein
MLVGQQHLDLVLVDLLQGCGLPGQIIPAAGLSAGIGLRLGGG